MIKVGEFYNVFVDYTAEKIWFCRLEKVIEFHTMAEFKAVHYSNRFFKPIYFDQILDAAPATDAQVLAYRLQGGKI